MWKNGRFLSVAIVAVCAGFVNANSDGAAPIEFKGRFELRGPLAVGKTAGTADYPELVRIETICFDTSYGNAWGVTARIGWLPVKEATWRLMVELLDEEGRLLRHSRDDPMVFTCKASKPEQSNMHYADLDMGAMHDQDRRHAARFRVRLEPSEEHVTGEDAYTLEVAVIDQESREPVSDATVVISYSYLKETFRRNKTLYVTDSQGCCRITLIRDGLAIVGISAQKQGYCTIMKSWSNSGSWGIDRAPLINLPERHVLEMVRASALGGIVQDSQGEAIKDVGVHLEAHLEEPSGMINVNRSVRTDASGRWRVEGIPIEADRITLRLRHAEYGGNNGRDRWITADALVNARAFKHTETLEKGLTITGRVLDEQGQPVADATVMLVVQSYRPVYALTDASRAFRLACSSDRSAYREIPSLIVEAPGYAPIQQNIDLQPAPEALEFRLKHGRNITCRVVDTKGQPVVGAWTVVEPLEGNRDYSVWLEDTNDKGEFQILNVPQNDVKLTIGKEGYIAIRDHVVTASEDEVVVTMKHAMHVHGAVTDAETGKAIRNFEIIAVYATGGRTNTSRPVAFAEGTYEVNFDEAQPETRQLQVSAVGYKPDTSQVIKVDEGDHAINFKLARSTSFDETTAGHPREQINPTGQRRITGVVRDEHGKPVPDAIVVTYPQMGTEALTNAKGVFTLRSRINGMREETTYLHVRQKERNLAAAVEIDTLADTVDVTLAPGAILSGKVVDVEGKGIPSAELSLTFWTSSIGYNNREVTEIDQAGHYEIRAVPPGHKYSVNASAEGYGSRYVQVDTGGAENQRLEVEPLVLSVANLSASGVVVDDLDQPVAGIIIHAYGNGQPSKWTFTDTKGRFTIKNVCPGRINILANSKGGSVPRFHGEAQTEGGATNIKIIAYQMDEHGWPMPSRPPSLVGKSLPELEDLGIDLSPADIKGKRILICFWDMEQRPSRRCMSELARRVDELKGKSVAIIAVQASKVDENTFSDWVKKNNVPFAVGMVRGDAEKALFDWGVQSLPWLILTDSRHVVSGEGFGLDELDIKIKAAE